ncbi:GNAT family N-acetyltransferase [Modestobacter sp. VKM Ac-2985]|uniref:GNAT family N-acetyltransferase n=1 Tax=Modestobacter sp. VKM Ac-2985 TaxID=3004139 RepID=UPI0022AB9A40|nr:GNAT family N-acetyltransferase [Modestobacter sp. VKM Ac-2985]MCZ2836217.1 GNAT family N-acetyltransferase [Modestobacter sp. VKM Ac-2985]
MSTVPAAPPWSVRTPVGVLTLEPLDLDRDLDLLHAWVTHPRSVYWLMQDAEPDAVHTAYAAITADPHHDAWLGRVDGAPAFLAETYDPRHRELVGVWAAEPGDVGMHVLVAPPAEGAPPVRGLTSAVMAAVVRFSLDRPGARRVVVEPDARNAAIRAKNRAAGFVEHGLVDLGHKTAALSTCTPASFAASELGGVLA